MKALKKLRNYIFPKPVTRGEEMKSGFKTCISYDSSEAPAIGYNRSIVEGDRKRYFGNFDTQLLSRISDIKSKNS